MCYNTWSASKGGVPTALHAESILDGVTDVLQGGGGVEERGGAASS